MPKPSAEDHAQNPNIFQQIEQKEGNYGAFRKGFVDGAGKS